MLLTFAPLRVFQALVRAALLASCCLALATCVDAAPKSSPSEVPRRDAQNNAIRFRVTGLQFEERHRGERVVYGCASAAEGNFDQMNVSRVAMFRKARDGKTLEGPFRAQSAQISLSNGAASFTDATFQRGKSEGFTAPRGAFDPKTQSLRFEGPVELTRPRQRLRASGLQVDLLTDVANFTGPVVVDYQGQRAGR